MQPQVAIFHQFSRCHLRTGFHRGNKNPFSMRGQVLKRLRTQHEREIFRHPLNKFQAGGAAFDCTSAARLICIPAARNDSAGNHDGQTRAKGLEFGPAARLLKCI
jgi:hypothetical protein